MYRLVPLHAPACHLTYHHVWSRHCYKISLHYSHNLDIKGIEPPMPHMCHKDQTKCSLPPDKFHQITVKNEWKSTSSRCSLFSVDFECHRCRTPRGEGSSSRKSPTTSRLVSRKVLEESSWCVKVRPSETWFHVLPVLRRVQDGIHELLPVRRLHCKGRNTDHTAMRTENERQHILNMGSCRQFNTNKPYYSSLFNLLIVDFRCENLILLPTVCTRTCAWRFKLSGLHMWILPTDTLAVYTVQ